MSTAETVVPKCIVCESAIDSGDAAGEALLQCRRCEALQGWKPCVVCYSRIPKQAKRCSHCNTLQSWWRFVTFHQTTLAFLTALVAVSSIAITPLVNFLNRHSKTSVVFASSDPNYIYAEALNRGRADSIVRKAWLRFGELPYEDTRLVFAATDQNGVHRIVPAGGRLQLTFTFTGLQQMPAASLPADPDVTLVLEVDESNGCRETANSFNVNEIWPLINEKVGKAYERPTSEGPCGTKY
jgi:predicted nucleic acid-binding Zn ribbon protein